MKSFPWSSSCWCGPGGNSGSVTVQSCLESTSHVDTKELLKSRSMHVRMCASWLWISSAPGRSLGTAAMQPVQRTYTHGRFRLSQVNVALKMGYHIKYYWERERERGGCVCVCVCVCARWAGERGYEHTWPWMSFVNSAGNKGRSLLWSMSGRQPCLIRSINALRAARVPKSTLWYGRCRFNTYIWVVTQWSELL